MTHECSYENKGMEEAGQPKITNCDLHIPEEEWTLSPFQSDEKKMALGPLLGANATK